MILCRLADAAPFAALHPAFPAAFAWLRANAASAAEGRHDLDGDACFALVQTGTTRDAADGKLESHRAYLDIQMNVAGGEVIEWAPVDGLAVVDDFKPGGDIRFHAEPGRRATPAVLAPGDIAILWPADGHKPVCHPAGAPVAFRKVVVKVRL